jgi:hypothetical protein
LTLFPADVIVEHFATGFIEKREPVLKQMWPDAWYLGLMAGLPL